MFLATCELFDEVLSISDRRVRVAHLDDRGTDEIRNDRFPCAEHVRVSDCSSQQPTQDVSPSLIRGNDTVGDEERESTAVVCKDP